MIPAFGSRALFPRLEAGVYLNHASISPPSEPVQTAVLALMHRYAAVGTSAFRDATAIRENLKDSLATLLGCDPTALALTSSATRGLTDIACCLTWRPGDRILCFTGEFPGNTTPWQQAAAAVDGEVVWVAQEDRSDDAILADVERELAAGIRLVAVSLVQFSTGRRMPVERIVQAAHAHDALVSVDAIQALGVVPVDVTAMGADILVGGAHKWLMGLEGMGLLYVRPDRLQLLQPRTAGWLSHEDPLAFLFEGPGHLPYDHPIRQQTDFFEGTSANALGAAALDASVGMLLDLGIPAIHAHVTRYLDTLEDGLVARGFRSHRDREHPTGILSVIPPDGDAVRWSDALADHGVFTSPPDGKLRLSPHWPNALSEIPHVLSAVDAIAQES
jgi:selenocysteine lyase/cysteine desulfurase